MLGPKRELRDVFGLVLTDDDNVVFTVSTGAGLPLGDGDHRLHGNDHARFDDRVDVLTQLEPGLPTVVVAEHTERMPISERPVGQQPVLDIDLVEFGSDVLAHRPPV